VTWNPIETAPKDGSTFIGWCKRMREPVTVLWNGYEFVSSWDGYEVIYNAGEEYCTYQRVEPMSHWSPLLEPPECEEEAGS